MCKKEGPEGGTPHALNEDRTYCQDNDDDEELWLCGDCLVARPYDVSWWCYAGEHARCSYGGNHALNRCNCDCHPRPAKKSRTVRCPNCSTDVEVPPREGPFFDV